MALLLMKDANEKFGRYGSLLKSGDNERVITVSFEGLLSLKETSIIDEESTQHTYHLSFSIAMRNTWQNPW